MLRGVLDLCLLAVIMDEPAYGYEMTRRLRERGLSTVGEGSIYPLLGRLERDGLVATHRAASDGGPPRKYYRASRVDGARSPRECGRGATSAARSTRFWRRSKRRWRDARVRRGVPAGVEAARRARLLADEMAAELEADLAEAEADGVSAAEMLGESDPRRFAANWARERGLVAEPAPKKRGKRWLWVAAFVLALVFVVVLGLFAAWDVSTQVHVSAPQPQTVGAWSSRTSSG